MSASIRGRLLLPLGLLALSLLACAPDELLLSFYLLLNEERITTPAEPGSREQVPFTVQPGETAAQVAARLEAQGLIADAELFRALARYSRQERSIQAGDYLLSPGMNMEEILAVLAEGRIRVQRITVREGLRAEEVAALLEGEGLAKADAFLSLVTQPAGQYPEIGDPPGLEGYLFPDTYTVPPDVEARDLVDLMVANFDRRVTPELREGFARQGLSLHQAVTLASIVEREAQVPQERKVIASVFLNRLRVGMKLDADPTVQYALGGAEGRGWWPELSHQDLAVPSAYNTYLNPGLPPRPIASPGLGSLEAVAFPEETEFYYFVARGDGSHDFSVTLEEHLRKVEQYRGGAP